MQHFWIKSASYVQIIFLTVFIARINHFVFSAIKVTYLQTKTHA